MLFQARCLPKKAKRPELMLLLPKDSKPADIMGGKKPQHLHLIPAVRKVTGLPFLAAGGIATGESMLAAMVLGADGVQIGSRFAISEESSAHPKFKNLVSRLDEGETKLVLKQLAPVRLIKNAFYEQVEKAEKNGLIC